MSLALIADLKNRLSLPDATDDALLQRFLDWASAAAEGYCNRAFAYVASDTYIFSADRCSVVLPRYPVVNISLIETQQNSLAAWATQSVDYTLRQASGILDLQSQLGTRTQLARITYSGGYVLPGNTPGVGQTALPGDLENSIIEQAAAWYVQRNSLRYVDGDTVSTQPYGLTFLPQVRNTWDGLKRIIL